MPKKTRKEKIESQKRKEIKKTSPVLETSPKKEIIREEPKISQTPLAINLTQEENTIRKYFEHDLRKSLLIIGVIFALEFFFYFATMNNYLGRYLKF